MYHYKVPCLLVGIWGIFKGSWGVLGVPQIELLNRATGATVFTAAIPLSVSCFDSLELGITSYRLTTRPPVGEDGLEEAAAKSLNEAGYL